MAEALIRTINNTHADQAIDIQLAKRGHFIDIKPDGHPWGADELGPGFVIIKFKFVPSSELGKYLEPHFVMTAEGPELTGARRWRIDLDALEAVNGSLSGQQNRVKTSRYAGANEIEWAVLRPYLIDTTTGLGEVAEL